MKALRISTPVKYILIIFAVVFAAFVYSFWGAKLESQNKDIRTPEAYGLDSLKYQAEPVMEIRVWQRNDKEEKAPADSDRDFWDSYYFDILPLEVGASVDTMYAPMYRPEFAVLDISYDGEISGYYSLPARNMISYTGETDIVPVHGYRENILMNEDATFSGNRKVTLSIETWTMWLGSSLAGGIMSDWVTSHEQSYGFRFKDYYHYEYFHEVYPDALQLENYQNLKKFKRIALTTYLTVQAMHPTKPDIPVATAVLEITQYSSWFGATLTMEESLFVNTKGKREYYAPGRITVVSYEQSHSFSMG